MAFMKHGLLTTSTGLNWQELLDLAAQAPNLYRRYPKRKSSGGLRWLSAPQPELKIIQRRILDGLLYRLSPHPAAHGFVPHRSVVSHAKNHVGQRWLVGLDIQNFFDETGENAVRSVLDQIEGLSTDEIDLIVQLCCLGGALPQGAPTSPCLANLYFKSADEYLSSYAQKHHLNYTRYADDLAFSGAEVPEDLMTRVSEACSALGYGLASRKTRVLGSGTRQLITGLVVNQTLAVPRPLRRRLRAIIHDAKQNGLPSALERADLKQDSLLGLIGWVSLTNDSHGKTLHDAIRSLIE
jgi:RNA-directed DNA polymerase